MPPPGDSTVSTQPLFNIFSPQLANLSSPDDSSPTLSRKRKKSTVNFDFPTTYKRKPTKSHERQTLHRAFEQCENPTAEEVQDLAAAIQWDPKRVKQWFSNRRSIKKREVIS